MDVEHMRCQRADRVLRRVAVDDEIGRIEIDADRACRQAVNQAGQVLAAFRARFGRQQCTDSLAISAQISQRCGER